MIDQNETITCLQKFYIFKNVCSEIEKLHLQNKIYKYLCPENIFVDNNFNVTLRQFDDNQSISKELLNWAFGSPETLMYFRNPESSNLTTKIDTWSIGLLLNVIFTMKNIRYARGCVGFYAQSEYFFEIIPLCMKHLPSDRPNISHLHTFLLDFESDFLKKCNFDMKEAFKSFKQERYISSTIKLQKLSSTENTDECDDIEIKGSNHEFDDIKLEYTNFLFHASSKNANDNLYLLIQDRPQKITSNGTIKAEKYEIQISELNNLSGEIELQIKDEISQEQQKYSFRLNQDEYFLIGQDDTNQIQLPHLSYQLGQLQFFKKDYAFYVKQLSNMDSSINSIDSANIYIKLEKNTPIFHQSVICSENQKYLVKSIC